MRTYLWAPTHLSDFGSRATPQRPNSLRNATRIHRHLCPGPNAQTPVVPVLLRRLLPRRTAVDHQAMHRRPSTPTVRAGLRPAKNEMGLSRTKVRGLRPTKVRSECVFGDAHDLVVDGLDDAAHPGQLRQHVVGEEPRGRD